MATARTTVDFILEQSAGAGAVSARPMFDEYGLYCDGKMIGIIGEDQLFIKPTAAGRALAPDRGRRPPIRRRSPTS